MVSRPNRKRPRWVVGVAIGTLVALFAALALASVGSDGSGDSDAAASTSTSTTVPLNDAGRELLALLEKDKNATFHARYSASSAEQPNAAIVIETWRKPPRVRQDSEVTAGGQRLKSSAYLLGDVAIRCAQLGEAQWSCQRAAQDASADLLFGGVRDQLGKGPVTVRDDVVDGTKVRCFTLEAEGKRSELCARDDGVPVRVQSSTGASLRLIGFDATVSDEVFVPPAEPTPAS